jgi:hypothetical protein
MQRLVAIVVAAGCGGRSSPPSAEPMPAGEIVVAPPATPPPIERENPAEPVGFYAPDGDELDVDEDGLDFQIVHRVRRQRRKQLRACYESVLVTNPGLTGKLVLKIMLTPEGRVADAKATGLAPEMETCVAERVKLWQFPRPTNGVVLLMYPIVFARMSSDGT